MSQHTIDPTDQGSTPGSDPAAILALATLAAIADQLDRIEAKVDQLAADAATLRVVADRFAGMKLPSFLRGN